LLIKFDLLNLADVTEFLQFLGPPLVVFDLPLLSLFLLPSLNF